MEIQHTKMYGVQQKQYYKGSLQQWAYIKIAENSQITTYHCTSRDQKNKNKNKPNARLEERRKPKKKEEKKRKQKIQKQCKRPMKLRLDFLNR